MTPPSPATCLLIGLLGVPEAGGIATVEATMHRAWVQLQATLCY